MKMMTNFEDEDCDDPWEDGAEAIISGMIHKQFLIITINPIVIGAPYNWSTELWKPDMITATIFTIAHA